MPIVLSVYVNLNHVYQVDSSDEGVRQLLEDLKSNNHDKRRGAVNVLGIYRSKYSEQICELIDDKNIDVKLEVIYQLGLSQEPKYADKIAAFLNSNNSLLKRQAISALGTLKADKYKGKIAEMLNNSDALVVRNAVSSLGEMNAGEYSDNILKLLYTSRDDGLKFNIGLALAKLRSLKHLRRFAISLVKGDNEVFISNDVVLSFSVLDENELVELIGDSNPVVRLSSLSAFASRPFLMSKHLAEIAGLLNDTDQRLRQLAIISLKAYTKEYTDKIVAMLNDKSEGVRCTAIYYLENLGAENITKDAVKSITELLKDISPSVRRVAINFLINSNSTEYADEIAGLLDDKDLSVLRTAIEAIGHFKLTKYGRKLAGFLVHSDMEIEQAAISALIKLKDVESIGQISDVIGKCDIVKRKHIAILASYEPKYIISLLDSRNANILAATICALELLEAKEYAKQVKKLVNNTSKCRIEPEIKHTDFIPKPPYHFREPEDTTVGDLAQNVISKWEF
ncbi:MAG: HEAT repeat domain-containing protein [Planctomycetes bacterium]|nr:HEAT repeat domain-containing protein [Planctomycetota bacterium]